MDAVFEAPGTPTDRIRAIGRAYPEFFTARPEQFSLLALPQGHDAASAAIAAETAALIARQNAELAALVAEGARRGESAPTTDPAATADALWATADGLVTPSRQAGAGPRSPAEIAALVAAGLDLLLRGLLLETADAS